MQKERQLSVYAMVNNLMAESKEKLASQGHTKQAAVAEAKPEPSDPYAEFLKIARACDHLAGHIHLVNDERSPEEKLAEYAAIHNAVKQAAESGDVDPNKAHQQTEANSDSVSPKTVSTDDSGTGVGQGNAIPSEETNTPGTPPDAGEQGAATTGHQSPKSVQPNEAPNEQDASNALESNQEMMMADQPEDLLKQNSAVYQRIVAGKEKMARAIEAARLTKKASVLYQQALRSGVPEKVAQAIVDERYGEELAKLSEDAINPAQISGSTEPALQSAAGVPSPLSQGSEAGELTPRETAPTSGEGGGRELVSSNEAAMNATKGQAKAQNKGAVSEVLTEPSMSAAHDKTLQKSLDNTSSAGVKISSAGQVEAARELLRKFQDSSPENAQKLAALHKLSQDPDMAAGGGAPPAQGEMAAAPDDEALPEAALEGAEGAEAEAPSEEALEAAQSGVTPEELAQAQELLALQGAAAQEAEAMEAGAAAPEAPEKQSFMPGMDTGPEGGGSI